MPSPQTGKTPHTPRELTFLQQSPKTCIFGQGSRRLSTNAHLLPFDWEWYRRLIGVRACFCRKAVSMSSKKGEESWVLVVGGIVRLYHASSDVAVQLRSSWSCGAMSCRRHKVMFSNWAAEAGSTSRFTIRHA